MKIFIGRFDQTKLNKSMKAAKTLFILFLIMITRISFSQEKEPAIIKESFIPLLDSLIQPPQDCKAAFDLMTYDSIGGTLVYNNLLKEQSERINKLYTELTIMENKFKSERSSMPKIPNAADLRQVDLRQVDHRQEDHRQEDLLRGEWDLREETIICRTR
jgi:hypothetical protein